MDPLEVYIMADSYLRVWQANKNEYSYKEIDKLVNLQVEMDNNFLGHCWMLSNKLPKPGYLMIVLTNNNSIVMILNGQ